MRPISLVVILKIVVWIEIVILNYCDRVGIVFVGCLVYMNVSRVIEIMASLIPGPKVDIIPFIFFITRIIEVRF